MLFNLNQKSPEQELQELIDESEKSFLDAFDKMVLKVDHNLTYGKLMNLRGWSRKLFDEVRDHPDMFRQTSKLRNIFMPALQTAVDTYDRINNSGADHKTVRKSRMDLERIIELGTTATQTLMDKIHSQDQLNVDLDLEVLKKML